MVTLVQSFHVPLPYGTGFQDRNQDHELSGQGIFHILGNAFKYALSTNDPSLEPEMEGKNYWYLSKILSVSKIFFH